MELGIYPVGFPPLKKMGEVFQEALKRPMETDKEALMQLIANCKDERFTEEMFKKKVKPVIKKGWLQNLCTIL